MEKTMKKDEKVIDAQGMTLGRVSTGVATILMGKNAPSFERNIFSGFPVKVINASKIKITAKKLEQIYHTRYSGYPGGFRLTKGTETKEKKGMKELVKMAVFQMLPDNKLRKQMMVGLTVED